MRSSRGLVVGVMVVMVAGCGSSGPSGDGSATPSGPATLGGPSGSAYLPSPEPELTATPTGKPGRVERLTGVVDAGVEAGCLLLRVTGDATEAAATVGPLLLVGADSTWTAGTRVTVEGRREPELMTTCQQGTPFRITRVVTVHP